MEATLGERARLFFGGDTMRAEPLGSHVYIALVLAAVAALLSTPHGSGEPLQQVRLLLGPGIASEMSVVAGAIGDNPAAAVPP
jgi:hypothetical protein